MPTEQSIRLLVRSIGIYAKIRWFWPSAIRGASWAREDCRVRLAGWDPAGRELHQFDRITVAKIEGQVRSVFDYELALIANVLKVDAAVLYPGRKGLNDALEDLIEGRR